MINHNFLWVNQLFQWPFSIANCLFPMNTSISVGDFLAMLRHILTTKHSLLTPSFTFTDYGTQTTHEILKTMNRKSNYIHIYIWCEYYIQWFFLFFFFCWVFLWMFLFFICFFVLFSGCQLFFYCFFHLFSLVLHCFSLFLFFLWVFNVFLAFSGFICFSLVFQWFWIVWSKNHIKNVK